MRSILRARGTFPKTPVNPGIRYLMHMGGGGKPIRTQCNNASISARCPCGLSAVPRAAQRSWPGDAGAHCASGARHRMRIVLNPSPAVTVDTFAPSGARAPAGSAGEYAQYCPSPSVPTSTTPYASVSCGVGGRGCAGTPCKHADTRRGLCFDYSLCLVMENPGPRWDLKWFSALPKNSTICISKC